MCGPTIAAASSSMQVTLTVYCHVDIRWIQHRCRTELLRTVPVCVLDCIKMSLLAIVYQVNAVIMAMARPTM